MNGAAASCGVSTTKQLFVRSKLRGMYPQRFNSSKGEAAGGAGVVRRRVSGLVGRDRVCLDLCRECAGRAWRSPLESGFAPAWAIRGEAQWTGRDRLRPCSARHLVRKTVAVSYDTLLAEPNKAHRCGLCLRKILQHPWHVSPSSWPTPSARSQLAYLLLPGIPERARRQVFVLRHAEEQAPKARTPE